ncbi:putative polyketide hydroxylase [Micromonospora rhizosphaerae]|uniref:Putative polyketide hydroxylase n=1 Tax=Micromonospora rhizosphaerae TaxID=568872 RepID=A0A1C6SD29_9ACTN|nr:FAD-dependent monooxygenase [Micromonospora rhizosphaerae]SCL27370.1 putative polyketide hydroxylase [Micromonospora rhizosphaerae]
MTKNTDSDELPVLIVGGSLVGLSTALFLAKHGVESLTVERHAGTAIHPRAGHLHLRTLELMRSVGLEEPLQRLSAERFFPNGGINAMETLAGGEIATYIPNLNEGVAEFSPSRRLFVAQDALEPLLRERAEQLGATLRYSAEVVQLYQDADSVTAVVRDRTTGDDRSVRARYVVAADGNRSPIRTQLGIGMRGHGLLSRSATIYFQADCRELLAGTELGVIYIDNPSLRGFFRFERSGTSGFLVVNTLGDPTRPGALDVTKGLTTERAADLVRAAVGVPNLAVQVDDVAHWNAMAEVAERYQEGRIFLAGDAAHVVPPNGGFGGNTGIHDAHNLAWKLAMVVRGAAGEGLLDSYDAERRPVGGLTVDQAYSRYRHRVTPELLADDVPPLVDDFSMEIGYRYHSAAVVPDADAADDCDIVGHPRDAAGRPGTRAPHVEYAAAVSSLDLFGSGFVLLSGRAGGAWRAAARVVVDRLGVPLQAHPAGAHPDLLAAAYGITEQGAVLVRPDGFVGWRSRNGAARPDDEIARALQSLIARRQEAPRRNTITI